VIPTGARRLGALAFGALLLSACHASASVAIRVRSDGTGTVGVSVTLDRAARVALAGSGSSSSLPNVPLSDLRAHGWSVSSWRTTGGGGATVALTKAFTGSAGLSSALADLDGRAGALRSASVTRSYSLLRDRNSVSLLADLRGLKVGVSGDAQLASRLRAAGVDVAAIDHALQSQLGTSFDLSVDVALPDGTRTAVTLKPGSTREVSVASTTTHFGRLLALVAAAIAALLGLLMLLGAALNARRTRR
jgi:hypothetical protein